MTHNIDWKQIGLRGNPFSVTPPDDPEQAIWANHEQLRMDFERVFQEAKGSAPTQVVLCRGPIGGGKTHASLYYSLKERWPAQIPGVSDVIVLRIPTPKETGKPDRDLYVDVLEHLDLDHLRGIIKEAIGAVGHDTARQKLRKTVISSDLANAILRLGSESDDSWPLLKAYFLSGCTKTELRKLGFSRNIEKTQDYFRVLAGIFQAYSGFAAPDILEQHKRVCIWLDEMEDFVYFSPNQYRPFGQGLRELVDRVPNYLSIFLNFTLTSPEEYEEIELILGAYLVDRVTDHIFFDEMNSDEMLIYVRDLLAHFRIDASEEEYHPFDSDALKLMLQDLPARTPRDVNKRCRDVLLRAFKDGMLQEDEANPIGIDYVRKIDMEKLDKEVG